MRDLWPRRVFMRGFCKLVLLAAERQTTDGTAAEVETGDRDLRRDKIGRVRYLRSSIRCSTRTRTNERTRMPAHVDGWMDACMHGAPTHARTAAAKAYVAVAATSGRRQQNEPSRDAQGSGFFAPSHQQRAFLRAVRLGLTALPTHADGVSSLHASNGCSQPVCPRGQRHAHAFGAGGVAQRTVSSGI